MTGRANVSDLALAYGLDNDKIEDFTASVIEFLNLERPWIVIFVDTRVG